KIARGPAKIARGPAKIARGPTKVARGPAKIARGTAKVARGLAKIARAPAKVARGSAKVARGPAKIARGTVKIARGTFIISPTFSIMNGVMYMQPKTAILIGAGDRGARAYAPYALEYPHELQIVAVAEPNEIRRYRVTNDHGISAKNSFATWQEILDSEKISDIAIICTQDRFHYEPTIKALELGYHVLLEKPMSPDPRECIEMSQAAKKFGRQLTICHVLRYTEFWSTIQKVIAEGTIGEVASLQLNENVEIMHMSHSFVRGNWNNKEKSSPMILQKSCHDMDI